jgi:hypothetical protein
VVIPASLGGVRDDRRAVTAASHQAHTLVCVLRRPRSQMYVHAGTGWEGSFGTSPVSPHSMDPRVREAVPDRLGLAIFVPSCGSRVDRSGDRGKHHLCSAPIGMAILGALPSSGGPPPCPTVSLVR